MPVLDRQAASGHAVVGHATGAGASGAGAAPRPSLADMPLRSVPETAPTPLQRHYVNLSVIGLICGAVAITALEAGTPPTSPLVKLCVLIGAPILAATTLDASVRVWRAAWAWMPLDRGKGLFRLSWVAMMGLLLAILAVVTVIVVTA